MNASELRPGIYRVRHTDANGSIDFNLSVVQCHGLNFAAGFIGDKPPRRGKHKMLTTAVRQWIERMEELKR